MGGRRPTNRVRIQDQRAGQMVDAAPEPPAGLGTVGQAYWRQLTESLLRSRGLTTGMLGMLEALCGQWEIYCRWRWWLLSNLDSWTMTTRTGYQAPSPQVLFMRDALGECQRLWKLLRLAPEKGARQDLGSLIEVSKLKTIGDEESNIHGAHEA
jgi:phage terminase small subunit